MPTAKDFKGLGDPYLMKNILLKEYKSVSHYLDVQFRLFREDMIRPLRLGINQLLQNRL